VEEPVPSKGAPAVGPGACRESLHARLFGPEDQSRPGTRTDPAQHVFAGTIRNRPQVTSPPPEIWSNGTNAGNSNGVPLSGCRTIQGLRSNDTGAAADLGRSPQCAIPSGRHGTRSLP